MSGIPTQETQSGAAPPSPPTEGGSPDPAGVSPAPDPCAQLHDLIEQAAGLAASSGGETSFDRGLQRTAATVSVGSLFQSQAVAITDAMFTSVSNFANSSILQTATTAAAVRDIQAAGQVQGLLRLAMELSKIMDKSGSKTVIEGSSIEAGPG